MAMLPSYQEATARTDWLRLVAPYLPFTDYRSLCLVNRHFWSVFAPPLWRDLFKAARSSGLAPEDDWWLNFVFTKLHSVAPATRALVRVLDARAFAKDAVFHFGWSQNDKTLQGSFKLALELLPNVESLLLDGHADLDPSLLMTLSPQIPQLRLRLLSLSGCPTQLPNNFFKSPCIQSLLYLDISGVRGALWPLIHRSHLPDLRILKIRDREIDDATFRELTSEFRLRLWSLDLSCNKITDASIHILQARCFPATSMRSDARFRVEGKLVQSRHGGAPQYGPFYFIQESDWSKCFNHPERYLVDTPTYHAPSPSDTRQSQTNRSDGGSVTRLDSVDVMIECLLRDDSTFAAEHISGSRGITHLRLSDNMITSFGIEKLLRSSNGHIEDFACDSFPLFPNFNFPTRFWLRSARLYGMVGMGHIFRPVYASNLRVLRIHHSLVTNILTLKMDGVSALASTYVAEQLISPRVDKAFPLGYIPDMNPRLTCLTLTGIPRFSSGPLIVKLIRFIQLLSLQQRTVYQTAAAAAPSRRGPKVLTGIKTLRLEIESESTDSFSEEISLDAEELMNSDDQSFSFFDPRRTRTPAEAIARQDALEAHGELEDDNENRDGSYQSWTEAFVRYEGEWNGQRVSVPVWTGAKAESPNFIIREYCRMIFHYELRDGVGPVMPSQVRAGAPPETFIFHTAWYLAAMPRDVMVPKRRDLDVMKDVVQELRARRAAEREKFMEIYQQNGQRPVPFGPPHYFWGGSLEVTVAKTRGAPAAQFWR